MFRFFQEGRVPPGQRLPLDAANARIARDVLRLSPGDRIELLDGKGGKLDVELSEIGKKNVAGVVIGEKTLPRPWPAVVLLQGLPKGDKPALVVQKAVEWGAERIVFFETGRTVPRKSKGQVGRWERVAVEAIRQSGNPFLPELFDPMPLAEALEKTAPGGRSVLLDEEERARNFRDLFSGETPAAVNLAVGPEGGWSAEDRETLRGAGFTPVRLGAFTLRTETAAIGALAAVRALLG